MSSGPGFDGGRREREPFDWYRAACEYSIPLETARRLYEKAVARAGDPGTLSAKALYLAWLEDAAAARRHVGKRTLTMRASERPSRSEQTRRVDGEPIAPGKRTLTMSAAGSEALGRRAPEATDAAAQSPLDGAREPARASRRLDAALEVRMSRAFDFNFSGVSIRPDSPEASGRTRAVVKDGEVHFRDGAYKPGTREGDWLIAHELAHVVQQRGGRGEFAGSRAEIEREADRAASLAVMGRAAPIALRAPQGRAYAYDESRPHTIGEWWHEKVSKRYAAAKDKAYTWLIQQVRGSQQAQFAALRTVAQGALKGKARTAALTTIDILESLSGIVTSAAYAILGIVVGFVEGVVDIVKGLVTLLYTIIDLCVRFVYGFIDHGEKFDQRANEIIAGLKGLPAGLRQLIDDWKTRFSAAPSERQSLMIGELTGQVLAFIASFGVVAAKAGQIPNITLSTVVRAGDRLAAVAVTVDVASPAAAGVIVGTGVTMAEQQLHAMASEGKAGETKSPPQELEEIPKGLDKRLAKVVKDVIQRARDGKLLKSGNYHPHFDDATVLRILKDADAIYQSEGKAGRLIFRKGGDIVVVEGPGSGQGSVVTGYGPSGIKGESGASALGGAAGDVGAPITDSMIKGGTIPVPKGRPPIPKAGQIAP